VIVRHESIAFLSRNFLKHKIYSHIINQAKTNQREEQESVFVGF
jgi:hypothetical protein